MQQTIIFWMQGIRLFSTIEYIIIILALALMFLVPKTFTAIGFDSGGAAGGTGGVHHRAGAL